MANQSYLSVWCKNFPEENILERFGTFLRTVPLSATRPGFTFLTIRAVDPSEPPIVELDLRATPLDAEEIVEIAREHLHSDCSFEVNCYGDLTVFDAATGKSRLEPRELELFCRGEEYDDSFWRDGGHLAANLGFEDVYIGHAGFLGADAGPAAPPESVEEARFLEAMAWPENLEMYQEGTRENVRRLFEWVRRIQKALPIERVRLWSEGEEDFEARLEEIVATR